MRRTSFLTLLALLVAAFCAGAAKTPKSSDKPVHVRQYTRKDGTVVESHTRSLPNTSIHAAAPKSAPPAARSVAPRASTARSLAAAMPRASSASPGSAAAQRDASGRIERSSAAKRSFQASHPCPATGTKTGSCNGYVIDHVKPLACGGADAPTNMQWQTEGAAKLKDRTERAGCGGR